MKIKNKNFQVSWLFCQIQGSILQFLWTGLIKNIITIKFQHRKELDGFQGVGLATEREVI